jgi:glycosyltransferase involved in cell wall biosynthesis
MKLSVLMITYNHERFIAQALMSVLAQKVNFDFEIVIGEDCSTDGTRDILSNFQRQYPTRIILLSREHNSGVTRNLQDTLAACRGQYVAFLEGDDYWLRDDKLQKQADFLDAHPVCALCCHRAQYLDQTQRSDTYVFPSLPAGSYTIDDLLKRNFVMTCSAMLRREWIGSLPFWFSEMRLGDWPLFALVARHGNIWLLDEIAAVYRVHAGGVWTSRSQASQFRETIRMLRALSKELGPRQVGIVRKTIAEYYLELAARSRAESNRGQTANDVFECLRNGGLRLPNGPRFLAALAAYALLGSTHNVFSRGNRV